MPANESSLRVYFMGGFNSKNAYQDCVFLKKIGNDVTR